MSVVSLVAGAAAYRQAYPDATARAVFAASFGQSRGLDALYGRAERLETIGGFLWWRYAATLAVMAALWGVLSTTRVLRGDEEQGRTELLLTGAWPPSRLLRTQLSVLAGSAGVIGVATTVSCLTVGLAPGGSVAYGVAIALAGTLFVGIGAVTAQFARTRRRAAGVAGGMLGAAYLVRAMADGAPRLHALSWITPLGWVSRIAPFGADHSVLAAVLLVASTVATFVAADRLRARRDVGDGVVAASQRTARTRRIRSLVALDLVQLRAGVIGWCTGTALAGLVLGFIAADIAKAVADNPSLDDQTSSLTGRSLASVRGFVGLSFGMVAVISALYAGAQMATARSHEADGLAANLFVNGVSRRRWFATRLADAVVAVCLVTLSAAVSMWAGVRASGQSFALVDSLRGATNTLPIAAVFLGLAALTLGWVPRAVTAVTYGSVALAYVLLLVTALSSAPHWVIDLSPFSHLAPVPAAPANVVASMVLVALGAAGAAVGAVRFTRRDTAGA